MPFVRPRHHGTPGYPTARAPTEVTADMEVSYAVLMPNPTSAPTLAQLFEAEESRLLRFAIGLVGQRMVGEELVQETFLRLHQVWSQVENPRAWLYRSLRNLALNHRRDRKPETELNPEAHTATALRRAGIEGSRR